MLLPHEFLKHLPDRSNQELFDLLSHEEEYLPEALQAAKAELQKRNVPAEQVSQIESQAKARLEQEIKETKELEQRKLLDEKATQEKIMIYALTSCAAVALAALSSVACGYFANDAEKGIGTGFSPGELKYIPWIVFSISWLSCLKLFTSVVNGWNRPESIVNRPMGSLTLAVFSLVVCFVPFIGLPMAICAVRNSANSDGRGKKCAWVSVVINAAILVLGITIAVISLALHRNRI